MMFNRVALIAAAQQEIDERNQALKDHADGKNAETARAAIEWHARYGEAWLAAIKKMSRKLRAGKPLYATDMPLNAEWHGQIAVFDRKEQPPCRARNLEMPDLSNLVAVLSVIEDETVTPSGLRAVGVTAGALSAALRCLGRMNREG